MKYAIFIMLFSLSLWANFANAQTTYYCDPVNGNNSNNGSQGNPFATFGSVNWANVGLQNGDTIYLLDGQHGTSYMLNLHFTTNLIIEAVNPQQAVLTKITVDNCDHITFNNLKFDGSTGSFDKLDPIVVGKDNSSYITINNSLIQSADDSSTWTKNDWYANTNGGVEFRGGNITLTNNTFLNLYHAVELRGDNSLMQNNLIENFAADAIRGLGSNSTYENNTIKNCFIDDYAIQHDDAFQVYKLPNSAIVTNVIFRHNTVILFENPSQFVLDNNLIGSLMQGVIITDGNAESWEVENNLIINNQSHGITLYGAQNCRIQNNTVIQTPYISNLTDVPWISVQDQGKSGGRVNKDNIIRNNIAGRFTTWTYGSNTTDENNMDIDQSDVANYDNYFVDYANGDFHLIETSSAVNYGINVDLSATDLDGNDRVYDSGVVDAGCYEFQGDNTGNPGGIYTINSSGDGMIANPAIVTTNNPALTGISVGSPSEPVLFVGGRDANHGGNTSSAILPFRLPARQNGELVTAASLKVNVHYVKEYITSKIDLYGLPYGASGTIYATDHYDNVYTVSHGTDIAIQDNFIIRLASENIGAAYTPDREALTTPAGNTALIDYINTQYDAGATAGDYIFLRLNIDVPINASNTSSLPTAASHYYGISDETTGLNAPTLTIEITDATAGIEDVKINALRIFPNPVVNGRLNISLEEINGEATLKIYSIMGKLVQSELIKTGSRKNYEVAINLVSGLYVVKLNNGEVAKSQKLIVQ